MRTAIGDVLAIKLFFEQDGGRLVTIDEIKSLPNSVRDELGALCFAALGGC